MIPLLVAQLLAPVLLVGWLAVRPPRSAVGLAAQAVGSILALAGSIRAGLWLFPPWWTPWAALALVTLAAAAHGSRARWRSVRPAGALAWGGVALFLLVGGYGVHALVQARLAERLPDDAPVVDLAPPLGPGRYLVVNGGASALLNAHRASLRPDAPARLLPYRGNGHAVDLVGIDALGLRARGLYPTDPAAYVVFGAPVVAPCDGAVVLAVDALPDLEPPAYDRDHPAGNHVLLDCGGAHVLLGHLRIGSVRVREGARVRTGDPIGEVGNSGGSNEPHLHVHAQRPGPPGVPLGGDPLPVRLGGRWLVRGDRVVVR